MFDDGIIQFEEGDRAAKFIKLDDGWYGMDGISLIQPDPTNMRRDEWEILPGEVKVIESSVK